ncbi:MAG: hypothetical protein QOK48_3539 [Blastocatellia bacterium]|nr:hypothetical protein [Blastocatellia bacterium]
MSGDRSNGARTSCPPASKASSSFLKGGSVESFFSLRPQADRMSAIR